ncbi:hypothetical protein HDE_06673 [Halotydeus destructor]|nr:hypothetical protein HDE_06673 [Halotydeus destructor]
MSTLPYIRVLLQVRNDKHKLSVPKPVQPTTVFFSHLNTTVGDEQLKNACAAYGRVISAHCVNSQTGCRQGYAVYASYQEAYQAHLQANIELIPAKVLGIHPSVPSTIRIEDLRQFIRNNRPDLMEKDLLDDSQYYFEIMDSDFNEYIRVHEDTAISDMSRLRICPKFEVEDNLDTFSTLSHPFPHRRSHHTAVATNLFQNLGNQPLNSTFDENSLSGQITSFNEPVRDAPDLIAAIGTGRPSHGRLYSENAETPPRIVHDLIDVNYQPPAHASVNDLDDNRNTFFTWPTTSAKVSKSNMGSNCRH